MNIRKIIKKIGLGFAVYVFLLLFCQPKVCAAGSIFYFGSYPQIKITDDNLLAAFSNIKPDENGYFKYGKYSYQQRGRDYFRVEPISWKVIGQNDSYFTLLSEKIIDSRSYGGQQWNECSIRQWLNSEFLSRAFTASEQRDIQSALIQSEVLPYPYGGEKPYTVKTTDKVYLLDEADMMNPSFGFSSAEEDDVSRIAYVTDYVIDAYNGETKAGTYLLRAPGHWSYGNYQSSEISQTGGIGHWYHTWNRGVRPVIRVVKSSSNLSSKKPVPKEESIEYKVTLDACKGYFDSNKKVSEKKYSVTYGKKYPKFPSPKRSKYVFDGWYTKKTGGTKVTTASTVTKKTGHTLYAHWSKKTAISKAQIKINACTYNGQKQQPAVTVTLNGKTLKKGTDFTLSYSNNIQASSNAKVVITGKGKYNGTRTVKFKIQRCPIDNEHIQCDLKTRDYVYGGGEKKPIVILFHNGSRMTEGKKHDYTFQYKNNVQPGVASVVISGRGNYTGTRTVTFTIAKATQRITYLDSISKTYKEIKKTYKLNVKGVKEWAKVTYKSSNTNVASVSTSGKVRINGVGEAKITISCAETKHYKACKKVVPVVVKGETKIKTTYAKPFAYGKKEKLTVTTDSNGKVTFSSADSSIVKIDKNSGEMTAVKPGTTKITVSVAEDLKHTATSKKVNVTVEKEQQIIEAVDIKKTKSDGDFNINATLVQGDGKLHFQSSNSQILEVDKNGYAKIKGVGKVTVTVIASGTMYYKQSDAKVINVEIVNFIKRITPENLDNVYYKKAADIFRTELPNCTTYALGRAMEIKGSTNIYTPFIVAGYSDAENWMDNNKNAQSPLPFGNVPKVGAIAVWKNSEKGHVAIVEDITEDGVVYYSHSSYGGFEWSVKDPYPGSKSDKIFHYEKKDIWGKDLVFQGYIYLLEG